jgi:hypothetical protein
MYVTYFIGNRLQRHNQILTWLRFIHNWVIIGIHWMMCWWVLVHSGHSLKLFPQKQSHSQSVNFSIKLPIIPDSWILIVQDPLKESACWECLLEMEVWNRSSQVLKEYESFDNCHTWAQVSYCSMLGNEHFAPPVLRSLLWFVESLGLRSGAHKL